jgi:hypothetical protein
MMYSSVLRLPFLPHTWRYCYTLINMLTLLVGLRYTQRLLLCLTELLPFFSSLAHWLKVANCPLQHYHTLDYVSLLHSFAEATMRATTTRRHSTWLLSRKIISSSFTVQLVWSTPQVSVVSHKADTFPTYSWYLKLVTVLPLRDIMGVSTRQSPVEKSCLGVTLTTMPSSPLLRLSLAVQFSTQWG